MKKALIYTEQPLKLHVIDSSMVDTNAWHVNVIAGQLDSWRDVAANVASVMQRDAARAGRNMIAGVAGKTEIIYGFEFGAAVRLADIIPKWLAADSWVSPPHPSIPEDTPEHDVIALKKHPPGPPPDLVPGDVYKRIPVASFPDEEWWPGSTALSFPASSWGYRERLENALQLGDYDLAQKLVMVSPGVSKAPPTIKINDFGSNPDLLDSVTIYVMAGAPVKCAVSAHFYSRRLHLTAFLASAVDVLVSAGYECYRSRGIETFKEWATTGRLPSDLAMLSRESL